MSEKNKLSKFWSKIKNTKVNKAAVITAAILVIALAVIVTVTIATNRKKKDNVPEVTTKETTSAGEVTQPGITTTVTEPETTTKTPDVGVVDNLPSFILPVNGVLSKSHDASVQVFSQTMNDYRVHIGVDIVCEENAPVYAAADGTVSRIWEDTLLGYSIAIKHSGGSYTIYKNLSKELPDGISEGVKVRSGQLIATVGNSAMIEIADEPHLHFEMTIADLSVDPLKYFDENALETLKVDSSHGE